MGYTHGTPKDAKTKICSECGEEFPNTREFFYWIEATQNTFARCKKCSSKKAKERNKKMKLRFEGVTRIIYEGTKKCIKCGRDLPNDSFHFNVDKTCVTGLRNTCRECDPKGSGNFLSYDFEPQEKWSDEELELLKENYHDYTNRELQEKFFPNRTIRAIECAAQIRGWNGKSDEAYWRSRAYQREKVSEIMTGRVIPNEWRAKISASKKEYYKTHDSWWKGRKRSEAQRKQISERMKGKWAGDKNPRYKDPLNGERNGRWKGGINKTYAELRSETKDWQQESMQFCNFTCVITGGEFDNVHHTTPFRDIVDQIFDYTTIDVKERVQDYDKEDFESLRIATKTLHDKYGYGACINESVHKLFHDLYGYTKITPYDFLDFMYRIDNGEFDNWFSNNNLTININYEYVEYLEQLLLSLEDVA